MRRGAVRLGGGGRKKNISPRRCCAYVGRAAWIGPRARLFQRHSHIREPARRSLGLRSLVGEDGMRRNALLQLGTGLGTPGTARKEDLAIAKAASVRAAA